MASLRLYWQQQSRRSRLIILLIFFSQSSPIQLTNGANIVGLLSTPEFVAATNYYPAVPEVANNAFGYNVYSNHIVAYVHSLIGVAS